MFAPAPKIALFWLLLFATAAADDRSAPPFSAGQIEFFETRVRPLLAKHCYECHSERAERLKGGLRLDHRELAIRGGESGAAIVPGRPDESLLVDAVRWQSYEMPPKGKLSAGEIQTLVEWIEMGSPWPGDPAAPAATSESVEYDWNAWRREHWAFQPIGRPSPPEVRTVAWVRSDIDRFILARLESAGLEPAPPADPRALARRITFDLIGLPPEPADVDRFVAACQRDRQAAVRDLVDTLLASPHYGERWGRHWLDVARYSDGYGGFLDNNTYADAWRYRDWVVRAFNDDMPFDRFIRLQIAGDLLGDREDAIATGFFALGPTYRSDGGDPDSVAQAKAETLSDRLDTLGRGVLALTLACARCHDHKFDPVPQRDYYSLAGIFNNTSVHELPLAPPHVVEAYDRHQQAIGALTGQLKELRNQIKKENAAATPEQTQQLDAWQRQLEELERSAPAKYDVAHALRDSGSADMNVAVRGDLGNPGEPAPRRFLRILSGDEPPLFDDGSGRRQLAVAVSDPAGPLMTRVFVNRVWMHHFGRGLVRTPSNFGASGERPTHPELLDWLTAAFIDAGQSTKSLHRTIMLSAAYQMSSDFSEPAFRADGDNRLVWRMNPRRLDVESWRDALLSVTGEIDLSRGGPPTEDVASPRRTLYFKVSRNGDVFATDEFLRRFDFPLMRATIDKRPLSIVPQQYLFLMNSPFMIDRARALATRLAGESAGDAERIGRAYELLFQREPTSEELAIGLEFVGRSPAKEQELPPWEQYCQVLLGTNEFMYVR